MVDILPFVFSRLRKLYEVLAEPLREGDDASFRLSSPETQTTTIDGDVGWGNRPPARLTCGRCGADVEQVDSRHDIDCQFCVGTFSHEEFPDLELQCLICPVCGDEMEHGRRHPDAFDVPEWATCHSCRYHWEFRHSY